MLDRKEQLKAMLQRLVGRHGDSKSIISAAIRSIRENDAELVIQLVE